MYRLLTLQERYSNCVRRRPRTHRGGNRSGADLCHQRRQTLQVGAARAAADPWQTWRGRDRGLPSVAGGGDRCGLAANHRRSGSNRGAGCVRTRSSRDQGPRPAGAVGPGAACIRHRSSFGTAARSGRGDAPSRNPALCRRSPTGCGAVEMIGRIPSGSLRAWSALALASATVLAVAVVVAGLWSGLGDSEISLAGALAMIFGVIVALALGIGLMSLVFISNRRGYDEAVKRDH